MLPALRAVRVLLQRAPQSFAHAEAVAQTLLSEVLDESFVAAGANDDDDDKGANGDDDDGEAAAAEPRKRGRKSTAVAASTPNKKRTNRGKAGGSTGDVRVACVVEAVKFCARFVASQQTQPERVRPVLAALQALLGPSSAAHWDIKAAVVSAVLRVGCERPVDELIEPALFQSTMWTVFDAPSDGVARTLLAKYRKKCVRLPVRYLCVALAATQCSKASGVRAEATKALQSAVDSKRAWLAAASQRHSGDEQRLKLLRGFALPEYVLPHAVHLLAHWRGFEADATHDFAHTLRWLRVLLDALLRKTEHFTFVRSYLDQLRTRFEDATEPDASAAIVRVCELAHAYASEQSESRSWRAHAEPNAVVIPQSLFRLRDGVSAPSSSK